MKTWLRDKSAAAAPTRNICLACMVAGTILSGLPLRAAIELTINPPGNAVFAGIEQSRTVKVNGLSAQAESCTLEWSLRTTPSRRTIRTGEQTLPVKRGTAAFSLQLPVPPTKPGVTLPLQLHCAVSEKHGDWVRRSWDLQAMHQLAAYGRLPADLTLFAAARNDTALQQLRAVGLSVTPVGDLRRLAAMPPGVLVVQPTANQMMSMFVRQLWSLVSSGWKVLVIEPPTSTFHLPERYVASLAVIRLVDERIVRELNNKLGTEFDIPRRSLAFHAHDNQMTIQADSQTGRCVWAEFVDADSGGVLVLFTLPRMEPEIWEKDARARYLLVDAIRHVVGQNGEKGKET